MSIVAPIMLFAVAIGLFVPRMTKGWWFILIGWILILLVYNYFKPLPQPNPTGVGLFRNTDVNTTARQA